MSRKPGSVQSFFTRAKYAGAAALAFAAVAWPVYEYNDREEAIVTVRDKQRVPLAEGGSVNRVYTDKGTFENRDSWLFLKFNSEDVQGDLEVGRTYRVTTNGWRVPFLSMFRNIVTAEPVRPEAGAVPPPSPAP